MILPFDPRLIAISPDDETKRPRLAHHLEILKRGGVSAFMFREKSLDDEAFLSLGSELRGRADELGLPFILNERSELAEPMGARIVHLTWRSRPLDQHEPGERLGRVFGRSVHSLDEAKAAEQLGFNYLVFGPIFPTPSKVGLVAVQGLGTLAALASAVGIPVVAVGGVSPKHLQDLRRAGAQGVAVLSGLAVPDAETRAAALRAEWEVRDD